MDPLFSVLRNEHLRDAARGVARILAVSVVSAGGGVVAARRLPKYRHLVWLSASMVTIAAVRRWSGPVGPALATWWMGRGAGVLSSRSQALASRWAEAVLADAAASGAPLVLYLRGFDLETRGIAPEGRGELVSWIGTALALVPGPTPVEERLLSALGDIAPVVAVQNPANPLPFSLGAVPKLSLPADGWQSILVDLVRAADLMVMAPATLTPGVLTELDIILGLGRKADIVIVVVEGTDRFDTGDDMIDIIRTLQVESGVEPPPAPQAPPTVDDPAFASFPRVLTSGDLADGTLDQHVEMADQAERLRYLASADTGRRRRLRAARVAGQAAFAGHPDVDLDATLRSLRTCLDVHEAEGDLTGLVAALRRIGIVRREHGDIGAARESFHEALSLCPARHVVPLRMLARDLIRCDEIDSRHMKSGRPVSRHQAAQVLRYAAGRPDDAAAQELAEHLGGVGLGLLVAAAACRLDGVGFERYLDDLRARGLAPVGASHHDDLTLAAVWHDALAAATAHAPDAAVVLALLARLDWRHVDREWLTGGLAGTSLGPGLSETLTALAERGLLVLSEHIVSITHDLVATGAEALVPDTRLTDVDESLVALLAANLPEPRADLATVTAAASTVHHVCTMAANGTPLPRGAGPVLNLVCEQLTRQQDAARLSTVVPFVLAHHERVPDADHPATVKARGFMAVLRVLTRHPDQAYEIQERVVADFERLLGPDHPDTLEARHDLAVIAVDGGKVAEGIRRYEQVVADCERALPPGHRQTLRARCHLAHAYLTSGRGAEALIMVKRVVADCERVLGTDHPDTLNARRILASAHRAAGQPSDSYELREQVAADCERVLGPDHPDTLVARHHLAQSHVAADRVATGLDLLATTAAAASRVLGADDPRTLLFRAGTSSAYCRAGRFDDAAELDRRVVVDSERVLGADHQATLTARLNLGYALSNSGHAGEAVALESAVVADRERILGADHPDTLTARHNLSMSCLRIGDFAAAVEALEVVVAARKRTLGPNHPTTANAHRQLVSARRYLRLERLFNRGERTSAD